MKTKLVLAAMGWMVLAATAFAQIDRDQTPLARQQAIDWFKAANIGGENGKMVPGVSKSISDILDEGRQALVLVPGDLSKDGKAYYGLTWAGLFHTFEVSSRQAEQLGMSDGVTTFSGMRRDDVRRSEPVGQLDHLQVERPGNINGDEPITGAVVCRMFGEPAGKLLLRVTYKRSGSTVATTKPIGEIPADGVLKFRLDAVNDESDETKHVGPLPLFAELCVESTGSSGRKIVVLSNTLALLLNVGESEEGSSGQGSAGEASLAGTTWQWTGSKSTVKFLPGGNVEYNDSIYGGKWTQTGDSVKFDSNGFTLFEVTLAGNHMSGTWRRLKGDDVAGTVSTSLTRLSP